MDQTGDQLEKEKIPLETPRQPASLSQPQSRQPASLAEAAQQPAASEDSSVSCPGMFEAGRGVEGRVQDTLAAAPGTLGLGQELEAHTGAEREDKMAALKERKDAAARDVKQHIDRW